MQSISREKEFRVNSSQMQLWENQLIQNIASLKSDLKRHNAVSRKGKLWTLNDMDPPFDSETSGMPIP